MRITTKILVMFLMLATTVRAQHKGGIYVGLGLGGTVGESKTVPDCDVKKGSPYIAGQISAFYFVNQYLQPGLKLITAGELISTGDCSQYNASANTDLKSGNKLPTSSILLCNQFTFNADKTVKPFIGLGIGTTTFFYHSITADVQKVSRTRFAVSPEIGINFERVTFSATIILRGKTPSFSGFDTFSNTHIKLQSTNSQQIYFTAAFKLFKF